MVGSGNKLVEMISLQISLAEDAVLTKRGAGCDCSRYCGLTERIIKEAGADGIYLMFRVS